MEKLILPSFKSIFTTNSKISKVLNYLINKYIFLGLCTSGLTAFSYYSLGLQIDWVYLIFVCFSTAFLYNNHDLLSLRIFDSIRILIKRPLKLLSFLSILLLFFLSISKVHIWVYGLAGLIIMGYYSCGILKGITFRKDWLKPLSIGMVYALITITYPAVSNKLPIILILVLSSERIIFIASLALIFDVGDAVIDKYTNPPTIPSMIGVQNSVFIAMGLIVLASMINLYAYYEMWINDVNFFALTMTYLLSSILFKKASPQKEKNRFYLTYIDGMIGFPFFILMLAQLGYQICLIVISHI